MTKNYKDYLFGGTKLRALRPATLDELEQHITRAGSKVVERDDAGKLHRAKSNSHKYWWCVCTFCDENFIVRSDHIGPHYRGHSCPESSPGMRYLREHQV